MPGRIGTVTLVPSRGGVFEVRRGDAVIFSKHQKGRFPNPGEVAESLG